MVRRLPLVLAIAAPLALLLACASDKTKPPTSNNNGGVLPPGNPPSGAGGGGEGGVDGGLDASDGGGACNAIANNGVLVDQEAITGDPPAQTGGDIAPGDYDLTQVSVYVGTGTVGPTGQEWHASINITGNTIQRVVSIKDLNSNQTIDTRDTYQFAATGSDFDFTEQCPLATATTIGKYTATTGTLTIVDLAKKELYLYTKR